MKTIDDMIRAAEAAQTTAAAAPTPAATQQPADPNPHPAPEPLHHDVLNLMGPQSLPKSVFSSKLATPLLPHSMASAVRRSALNRCQPLRAMSFNYNSLTTHNQNAKI
jgi:hypothetical protein